MLSKKGLLYSFACELLAAHGTAYHVMDEALPLERLCGRTRDWLSRAEKLGAWLAEERFRSDEMEKVKSDTEAIDDSYLSRAYRKLDDAAQDAHEAYPQIDRAMWLYHLYIEWFLYTLSEFDRLMQDETLRGTAFYQVYRENIDKFRSLTELLRRERPVLDPKMAPQKTINTLRSILDTTAKQLSALWRETVVSAVENELSTG